MKSIDEGREAVLAGAWGSAAALVVGLLALRFGPGWIPPPTDPHLLLAMAAAFLLNTSFLGLCYAAFLRLVPRPSCGGLLYGAAFAAANFVIDAAVLAAAFRYPEWLRQFSIAQRESVALFPAACLPRNARGPAPLRPCAATAVMLLLPSEARGSARRKRVTRRALLRGSVPMQLSAALKRMRGTAFAWWDTWLFVPLCLLLVLGRLVVAASES